MKLGILLAGLLATTPSINSSLGLGDPIEGDPEAPESPAVERLTTLTEPLPYLADVFTWQPAVTSGAATSAYIDSDVVYQASRSESPGWLFANDANTGELLDAVSLEGATGSWDMAMNGSRLAVGTNGNATRRATVLIFDTPGLATPRVYALPSSSSSGSYVMALVPDVSSEDHFWVGTYDPKGSRLYRLNALNGSFEDFTPGNKWSSLIYVRSLSATEEGLAIGMGNPGELWMLYPEASTPVQLPGAIGPDAGANVYALANDGTSFRAGISTAAGVSAFTAAGENLAYWDLREQGTTVDRLTVDEDGTTWFTLRPGGDLYRWDDVSTPPQRVAEAFAFSETRAIKASDGTIRGVTGTRQLWTYDGETTWQNLSRGDVPEGRETSPQGVLALENGALVGGHWRYQMTTRQDERLSIPLPGEPKQQIRVGDQVYTATYPYAALSRVDEEGFTIFARAPGQVRPRSLLYNEMLDRIYMGTTGAYGTYGGAISSIDPTTGELRLYETKQMPRSLAALGEDIIVGTSTAGEAVPQINSERVQVYRWNEGETKWAQTLPTSYAVVGVVALDDFIFAVTSDSRAFALDADTGAILWTTKIAGSPSAVRAVDNYVLVLSSRNLVEYFPSRTSLTQGLTLATSVRWADLDQQMQVALVLSGDGTGVQARVANPKVITRDAGEDRYKTAVAVSQANYASAEHVVLATGVDFPDALTAGPLASQIEGPVLLNRGTQLRPEVRQEIRRLGATKVTVVGGSAAIPESVVRALRSEGISVSRLGGEDRYETALQVARSIQRTAGKPVPAIVTTGMLFPDALSAAPAAASGAIVLSKGDTLPGDVASYLNSASEVATVGGPAQSAVERAGIRPAWTASGKDRYDTNAMVVKRLFPDASKALVSTGVDFPDGLTAGPAAAKQGAPVVLVKTNSIPAQSAAAVKNLRDATIVGGTAAVSQKVVQALRLM